MTTRRAPRTAFPPRALALATGLLLAGASLGMTASGCGDDPVTPATTGQPDATTFPDGSAADSAAGDAAGDADAALDDTTDADAALTDAALTDAGLTDALADTTLDVAPDVDPADQWDGTPPVDTSFPDLVPDLTPPKPIALSPGPDSFDVAVPFVVSITFDEPIYENHVAPQIFKLYNESGQSVPVDLALDEAGTTVTMTPTAAVVYKRASPYSVWVKGGKGGVSDLAGNDLAETLEFSFYTVPPDGLQTYAALAATYAPELNISMMGQMPQAHVPTTFDADGDWDGSNTKTWLFSKADTLLPAVYFNVAETPTHYFIHYVYFFPYVNHSSPGFEHTNGAPGAMVTVRKAAGDAPQQPVAVTTYYTEKQAEENDTFVTDESGLAAGNPGFYGIKKSYPAATLFPGGRFQAFITADEHESCLWLNTGESLNCKLQEAQKATIWKLVYRYQTGVPTPVTKAGGWPQDMADLQVDGEPAVTALDYALVPIASTLWPRRHAVGPTAVFESEYTYEPHVGGVGGGQLLGARFLDAEENPLVGGRPIWAWKFNPSFGGTKGIEQGWFGVDPAYYLWKRHSAVDSANGFTAYDPATGSGYAFSYCFNLLAGIDNRGETAACPAP